MKQRRLILFLMVVSLVGVGCTKKPQILSQPGDLSGTVESGAEAGMGQVLPEEPLPISKHQALLDRIDLPEGFAIEVFAEVPNARSLAFAYDEERNANIIFVATKDEGSVFALIDNGADNTVDETKELVSGWNEPNGVAYKDGDLYVAEIQQVHRFENIVDALYGTAAIDSTIFYDALPDDTHHGWKYIAFGPDGDLYIPVGAPCNVCDRELPYSSLMAVDMETKASTTIARGIRNTVGFAWDPETDELRFTDNGRDNLGDTLPPDELNKVTTIGEHFGYPYCYGDGVQDPDEGGNDCAQYTPPYIALGSHHAALGMKFYNGTMFPSSYKGKVLIAEHGSRNSSTPVGYRVAVVDPVTKSYEPFAQGWQEGEKTRGRPVDVLVLPDGSLLVSDDYAGLVYRITYSGV